LQGGFQTVQQMVQNPPNMTQNSLFTQNTQLTNLSAQQMTIPNPVATPPVVTDGMRAAGGGGGGDPSGDPNDGNDGNGPPRNNPNGAGGSGGGASGGGSGDGDGNNNPNPMTNVNSSSAPNLDQTQVQDISALFRGMLDEVKNLGTKDSKKGNSNVGWSELTALAKKVTPFDPGTMGFMHWFQLRLNPIVEWKALSKSMKTKMLRICVGDNVLPQMTMLTTEDPTLIEDPDRLVLVMSDLFNMASGRRPIYARKKDESIMDMFNRTREETLATMPAGCTDVPEWSHASLFYNSIQGPLKNHLKSALNGRDYLKLSILLPAALEAESRRADDKEPGSSGGKPSPGFSLPVDVQTDDVATLTATPVEHKPLKPLGGAEGTTMWATSMSDLHKKFDSLASQMETQMSRADKHMARSSPNMDQVGAYWGQQATPAGRPYVPRAFARGPQRDPAKVLCWICDKPGHRSNACDEFEEAKKKLELAGAKIRQAPGTAWLIKWKDAKRANPELQFLDYLRQHYMEPDYVYVRNTTYGVPNPIMMRGRPAEAYRMPAANQPMQVVRQQQQFGARAYFVTDPDEYSYEDYYEEDTPTASDLELDLMPDGSYQPRNMNS